MSVNTAPAITSDAHGCDVIIRFSGTFARYGPWDARKIPAPAELGRGTLENHEWPPPGERDFHEDCLMRRLIIPAPCALLLLCLSLPAFAKKIDSATAL